MPTELISYAASVVTALVGWYIAESIRSKNKADAAKSITEAATSLIDQKDEEIRELKQERTYRMLYVVYLLTGIAQLTAQLDGKVPAFLPMTLEEYTQILRKNQP